MRKKLARIGAIALLLVTSMTALLWFMLKDPQVPDPLIGGKPITWWTRQIRAGEVNGSVIDALVRGKDVAIPALIRQLSIPDAPARDSVKRLWRQLPPWLRSRLPEPTTTAELRRGAAWGLRLMYCNEDDEFLPPPAPTPAEAQMLLPALTNALHAGDVIVRLNTALVIGHLEVMAWEATEACAEAVQDRNWMVRANTMYSLGRLAKLDERATPMLKLALSDPHPEVREKAAKVLGELGLPPNLGDSPGAKDHSRR